MDASRDQISGYYDGFSQHLKKIGVNIRHRTIFFQLRKNGLKRDASVLEIGCGIGQVTGLMAKYLSKGSVTAVDISPRNIENAKQRLKSFKNVQFLVSDMTDFTSGKVFDFVVLPDVLEHIPLEQHAALFERIGKHTHAGSTVFINIPSPHFQNFLSNQKPEMQQIIDLSLETGLLVPSFQAGGFVIHSLKNYALAVEECDYQQLVLKKKRTPEKVRYFTKPELVKLELCARFRLLFG
jgi:cyclopropane fatty-acyl-phospholipid synthase-like methyltransferase